ncbi:polyprenol phosphomannose-dependent alpha 1,6 mannosyltransferase MptB [Kriegella aquimaris]|uniref:polyprenol phosphomannose-dependent alpha 1,6 mannosyltransferase MptB n=1 Tax=Kriegella aquimaris TaxID=192904 RepID=UPI000B7F51FE|nr:polyprenol phosphomannose-dependent alpha 1,6 mannosyltransferase MptB [Kriegella aquimaris]
MPNQIARYLKLHKTSIILALVCLGLYYTFAYHLERTDFIKLLTLFAALFFLFFKLIQFEKWNFKFLVICGVAFRVVFLLTEPNLSQDYYRFIWDGQLILNGINPYLFTPDTLMGQPDFVLANAQELHNGMGALSARHFSNYPPFNQYIFAITAFFGGKSILGSVIAMRTIIILADIGIFYFGRKLLKKINRSPHVIFWYFLNPLIIVELTGNLHFEGVMLFFFIWALYLLSVKKWVLAAVPYALSICVKLVPLIFLPLFLTYFKRKQSLLFYTLIGVISLILTLPFFAPEFLNNYSETVGLWFSNFEFNAGFYNALKKIAIQFDAKPWELIKSYGKITAFGLIIVTLLFTFLAKNQKLSNLIANMLWILTIYYFISATVHPWYVIFLVLLCIFTDYRFAIIWSAAIVLSYFAYAQIDFKEHMGLLAVEYISVYGFLIYEIFSRKGKNPKFLKN